MKITFLADDFPPLSFGGAGISTFELARGMVRAGHDVSVITTCRKSVDAGESMYEGLKIFRIASAYHGRWRSYVSLYNRVAVERVRRILSELRPDVVHANNIHEHISYASLKVAREHARTVIFTARDTMAVTYGKLATKKYLDTLDPSVSWLDNLLQARKRWNPLRNACIKYYLRYVDRVVSVSDALRDALMTNGITNVETIHTGIDVPARPAEARLAEFRRVFGLENKKILFFGGRLSDAKGGSVALDVLEALTAKDSSVVLFVAGPLDVYAAALMHQAGRRNLSENVVYAGWLDRERMALAYAVSHVVIAPSLYLDPFPRVVLEAMAAEKPVYACCYGGAKEAIQHGRTGFVAPPSHTDEIAEQILHTLHSPEAARSLGESGKRRIQESFALSFVVESYERLYRSFLRRGRVLVVFGDADPSKLLREQSFDVVIGKQQHVASAQGVQARFVEIDSLVNPGNIKEANRFIEDISCIKLPNGSSLSKLFIYKGFELWWMYYNALVQFYGIPYAQYKDLLVFVSEYQHVHLYHPPETNLFLFWAQAHRQHLSTTRRRASGPSFGVLLQTLLSLLSLPVLMVRRAPYLIYTSDKFDTGGDYDFRLKYIYHELRARALPFMECIRSLESWRITLTHFFVRGRPVLYAQGVAAIARWWSGWRGGKRRAGHILTESYPQALSSPERYFKYLVATNYLGGVYGDIAGIRLMSLVLRLIGIRAAYITAANERNYHTVLACKLLGIPTVGIMHGVSTRYFVTAYDFLPNFTGDRTLSVDLYGVWSEWWRAYYTQYSRAYRAEQLAVSGPMRPVLRSAVTEEHIHSPKIRVLFISEQMADPTETVPYLRALLTEDDFECVLKFRPYRDAFEGWLTEHCPELLSDARLSLERGDLHQAIRKADVVVGSFSTAALEALLQLRTPIFFATTRWGDFYDFTNNGKPELFAHDPRDLVQKIRAARKYRPSTLTELQEQFFGNPHQNGSAWVVDQLVTKARH